MDMQQIRMLNFDMPITGQQILEVWTEDVWLTRRQIASKLGCAKSPSLIAKLNGLAASGALEVAFHRLPNGVDMVLYGLTSEGVLLLSEMQQESSLECGGGFDLSSPAGGLSL